MLPVDKHASVKNCGTERRERRRLRQPYIVPPTGAFLQCSEPIVQTTKYNQVKQPRATLLRFEEAALYATEGTLFPIRSQSASLEGQWVRNKAPFAYKLAHVRKGMRSTV